MGEWFEDLSVHQIWGFFIAAIVLAGSFVIIRMTGEFLITGGIAIVGEPFIAFPFGSEWLFENFWSPIIANLSTYLDGQGFWHELLIGTLINGKIDYMQSFGLLTSGLFIPLGAVLPYIISFYLVLSILEDSGYLPRLAVFLDTIMHRFGLHGYAIIPTLLAMGCNVPGIMATRILETHAQRFIAATLISIAIPCASMQAMIIGLVGNQGIGSVMIVYGTLAGCWVIVGIILRYTVRGFLPELLIEIPPYRLPVPRVFLLKVWYRAAAFIKEAVPIVFLVILAVNILYYLKLFDFLADLTAPLVTYLWGLPKESITPLLIGLLRKDVAVGMMAPIMLSAKQLIIGCTILAMFFPCAATFTIIFRELGLKWGLRSIGVMLACVILVGTLLNLIL